MCMRAKGYCVMYTSNCVMYKREICPLSSTNIQYVCLSQIGDRILKINDVSVKGMTPVQGEALLKNITGSISLQVLSP